MPDAWAASTVKTFIRAWMTARERVITAGHEFVEMVEDLVEEVRHERAMEAQQAAAPPPASPTAASSRASRSRSRSSASAAAPSRTRTAGTRRTSTPKSTSKPASKTADADAVDFERVEDNRQWPGGRAIRISGGCAERIERSPAGPDIRLTTGGYCSRVNRRLPSHH
jgi:hypothetical protein